MRAHVIENNKVVNTIEIERLDLLLGLTLVEATTGGIGWGYVDGQFIEPVPEPVQVPQSVTSLQGLLAIDQAGLSSEYEAWANSTERTFAEKAFINKAQTWRRDNQTLITAAQALGLTDIQIDDLFVKASGITA